MEKNIKYYLIHGVDESRKPRMEEEFSKWGLADKNVNWMIYPNKGDITQQLYHSIVNQQQSWSCGKYVHPNSLVLGVVSCTYKHYLSLKNIFESDAEYGVIMEDNMYYTKNVPERVEKYIDQLNDFHPGWDILFDSAWKSYAEINESPLITGRLVYPKSNVMNEHGHGGTRCAQFYIVTKECARKMVERYLPFNNAPDWYMNDLLRDLNLQSFWGEPSISHIFPHVSTAT